MRVRRGWVSASGALCAAVGLAVLLGWHLENYRLIQVRPGHFPMPYNAALAFTACGLALLGIARGWPVVPSVGGGLTLMLGAVTALQYALGLDFRIDRLLWSPAVWPHPSPPGRIAPNAAACFVLGGAALILMARRETPRWRPLVLGLAGSLIAALGAVALFGYGSGLRAASGWGGFSPMALHGTIGFLSLGGAILWFAWQEGRQNGHAPRWAPMLPFVGVLVMAVCLWQALHTLEEEYAGHAQAVAGLRSHLPRLVLGVGWVLAFLLAAAVYLAQTARQRTRIAERASRELDRRVNQQRIVAELGRQALDATPLAGLLERAVECVAGGLGVELAKILELQPDACALLLRAGVGWNPGVIGVATVAAGADSQAGYTLLRGGPVTVRDLRQDTRFSPALGAPGGQRHQHRHLWPDPAFWRPERAYPHRARFYLRGRPVSANGSRCPGLRHRAAPQC
jgi:hypothetical protein